MDRAEQKNNLKNILLIIDETKTNLKDKEPEIEDALDLAEQLDVHLTQLGLDNLFDYHDFVSTLLDESLSDELSSVFDEIDNFKDEIDSYISELPESRAEKLEEKYSSLDEVLEKFDQSVQRYDSIENALEHIDESIILLKEMIK